METAVRRSQAACPPLPRRLVAVQPYLQQLAVSGIGEQVKEAVRPDTHVTDTRIQVLEQTLLADDPIAIQLQPDQRQVYQGADEQAALPGRNARRRRTPCR